MGMTSMNTVAYITGPYVSSVAGFGGFRSKLGGSKAGVCVSTGDQVK